MSGDTLHDMWCTCVNGSHLDKCQVEEIMKKIKQEKIIIRKRKKKVK